MMPASTLSVERHAPSLGAHRWYVTSKVMAEQTKITFTIKSFTARYDIVEDRLRLDAIDPQGNKQSIFMTRRLTDQVIPVLVSHLEAKAPTGVPNDISQSMSQLNARLERQAGEATPTVQIEAQTPRWLCKTVHFKKSNRDLIIIFTDDAEINAVISMTDSSVRIVLDILNDLYAKSGWPAHAVPGWLNSDRGEISGGADKTKLN